MSETDLFRNNLDAVVAALVDDDTLNEAPHATIAVSSPPLPFDAHAAATPANDPVEPIHSDDTFPPHEGAPTMSASTDRLRALLGDTPDAGDTAVLPAAASWQTPPVAPVASDPTGQQLRDIHSRTDDDDDEYTYGSAPASDDGDDGRGSDVDTSPRRSPLDAVRRHPRRTALIAGAVLIVAVVLFALTSGGDAPPGPTPAYTTPPAAAPTEQPSSSNTADTGTTGGEDQPIKIASASSRCPAGSTNPMQAFDDDLKTAWQCVRTLGIDGQVLQVSLGGSFVVSSISIVPGFNAVSSDQTDQWPRHRTVARVKYTFNDPDRTSLTQVTNSLRNEVITRVTPPVLATRVTITILSTAAPTGPAGSDTAAAGSDAKPDTDDFAVSEIHVVGHKPN